MNAGGVHDQCESDGGATAPPWRPGAEHVGNLSPGGGYPPERGANPAYARLLMGAAESSGGQFSAAPGAGPASYQLVGGVTASQGQDG